MALFDIGNLVKSIMTGGKDFDEDVERARKVVLFNIIIVIAVFALFFLGVNSLQINTTLGFVDLFVGFVLFLLFFYQRKTGNIEISALLGLLFGWALFFYLFVTGAVDHSGHLWSYTYPLVSTFLLGSRMGIVLSMALLICSISFQVIFSDLEGVANDGFRFALRFTLCYLLITLFAFFYESVRAGIQRTLRAKNVELEEKVSTLRATEEALQKTRNELEHRVEVRTAALRSAVEHLQQQIVEREKAERALLDSHERFVTVLEGIAADVYVTDIQSYEILFVNRHMRDSLGSDPLVGQPCWKAFRGLSSPCDHCTKFKLLDASGNAVGLVTWEAKNSLTGRWYVNHARAVRWDGNRMVRLQIATDITDQKLAEEALQRSNEQLEKRVRERTENIARMNETLRMEILQREAAQAEALRARDASEQANRAKSEFLANMSHELRTPLNHVIGFTELVADKRVGGLTGTQEEYLHDVLDSSRHLLSLINDILDLSKVEAGKLELEPSEVNIMALLESSLIMVKERAMKHGITLGVDYDGAPELIRADERKLKQVMYNLLSNAMKFTSDGGAIQIHAARVHPEPEEPAGKDYLKISVCDSGIGIQREDLERIFAPFEQVDSSATRMYKGTGLGLTLSKRFVELHGGKIWAESEGLRKGSTFAFQIPIDK